MKKGSAIKVVTWAVVAVTIFASIYIMLHGTGLSDSLDFGAGAYYYADIPDFDKMEQAVSYTSSVPLWLHFVLFLGWGFLMYRLWVKLS